MTDSGKCWSKLLIWWTCFNYSEATFEEVITLVSKKLTFKKPKLVFSYLLLISNT